MSFSFSLFFFFFALITFILKVLSSYVKDIAGCPMTRVKLFPSKFSKRDFPGGPMGGTPCSQCRG